MLSADLNQNSNLPIRIVSADFGHLSADETAGRELMNRLPYYFFMFIMDGESHYFVDHERFDLVSHELLFCLPYQILQHPASFHGQDYYKIGFDENCLSQLPKNYSFLLNPLKRQKIKFCPETAQRLKTVFILLQELLSDKDTPSDLIIAHLNTLMTEINTAYFSSSERSADERTAKFIDFKIFIENNLTNHPSIKEVAEELSVSTDNLYHIVKQYSGLSPKEYMTNRLISEAQRRLYYGEKTTVKELAFELGFNDPDYFSRLFKKVTGKTIASFFADLS